MAYYALRTRHKQAGIPAVACSSARHASPGAAPRGSAVEVSPRRRLEAASPPVAPHREERGPRMRRVRKVVFPVAGLGTRMLPATKVLPKEMLPVVDRPIIQYALEEAAAAGAEEFIFVTGRGKTIMEDHFDRAFELFETLAQEVQDRGAGGARAGRAEGGRGGLHPPAGAQGAGPRGLVRAAPGRRRAVRGDAGRRPDRRRDAVPGADGRGAARRPRATCWP